MVVFFQQIDIEGPSYFGTLLDQWGVPHQTVPLYERSPTEWPNPDDVSALCVLGGPMNVYEDAKHPFLSPQIDWIREYTAMNKPFLGICLGAQLLVHAMGGRVEKNPVNEVGYFKVHMNAQGRQAPLFQGLPDTVSVFQWHEDTFVPDSKGHILATSPDCPQQAVQYTDRIYGIQFHFEIEPSDIDAWCDRYITDTETKVKRKTEFAQQALEYGDDMRRSSARLLHNFLGLANLQPVISKKVHL
jgi:GMP synthase-like glutamine amidotransferase